MKIHVLLFAAFIITSVFESSPSAKADGVRIMPLGDSITQADPGYRGPLYEMLTKEGFKVEFVGSKKGDPAKCASPNNEGHGGFTIGPGKSKADAWSGGKGNIYDNVDTWLQIHPDIVLLLIGVNEYFNVGNLQPGYQPDRQGPEKLGALLDKIHEVSPQSKILVSSILPVGWSPKFALAFNEAIPTLIATRPFAIFVDLNKAVGFVAGDWSKDNLHPSEQGYGKLAKGWFDALKPVLSKP
jgi:acyl-CoA thioesterase-1